MKTRIFSQAGSLSRFQTGAAALEFALVLPVLLFLIYGVVVYGYMFIVQSSMTFAAQEGAQYAVTVDPLVPVGAEEGAYDTKVVTEARATAAAVLSWLPASVRNVIAGEDGSLVSVTQVPGPGDSTYVRVSLTYDIATNNFIFPSFNLGGLQIPPLPDQLVGESSAVL